MRASNTVVAEPPCFLISSTTIGVSFSLGSPVSGFTSVFSDTRHDRNLRLSPTTTQLAISGHSSITLFSIGTGDTFSPPAVTISSFRRPVTFTKPSASIIAWSPVCSQPSSSMVAAVSTGCFMYPIMTMRPLNSTSLVFGSVFTCTPFITRPDVYIFHSWFVSVLKHRGAVPSLWPSTSWISRFSEEKKSSVSWLMGAALTAKKRQAERPNLSRILSNSMCFANVVPQGL